MDWLENLLFNSDSIAHIVLLYSIVISLGVLLGRVKIFGVSLGVTFILFVGILMGHLGFNGNLQIINFVQDFGLILCVLHRTSGGSIVFLKLQERRYFNEYHVHRYDIAQHYGDGHSMALPFR